MECYYCEVPSPGKRAKFQSDFLPEQNSTMEEKSYRHIVFSPLRYLKYQILSEKSILWPPKKKNCGKKTYKKKKTKQTKQNKNKQVVWEISIQSKISHGIIWDSVNLF